MKAKKTNTEKFINKAVTGWESACRILAENEFPVLENSGLYKTGMKLKSILERSL